MFLTPHHLILYLYFTIIFVYQSDNSVSHKECLIISKRHHHLVVRLIKYYSSRSLCIYTQICHSQDHCSKVEWPYTFTMIFHNQDVVLLLLADQSIVFTKTRQNLNFLPFWILTKMSLCI